MLMFHLKMICTVESLNSILYIVSDLVLKECDPFVAQCWVKLHFLTPCHTETVESRGQNLGLCFYFLTYCISNLGLVT